MSDLDELVRMLNVEMENIHNFFEREVKPTTLKELAATLRGLAKHCEEFAKRVEAYATSHQPKGKDQ